MSETVSPPPASPYGPDPGASVPMSQATATPAALAPGIERARRALGVAALITGILSLVMLVGLIVMMSLEMGLANNDLAGFEEGVSTTLLFGSPVLIVVALNLVSWRALLRPLSRMSVGGRVALVLGMLVLLAIVSIALVAGLLALGFVVSIAVSGGSGF